MLDALLLAATPARADATPACAPERSARIAKDAAPP